LQIDAAALLLVSLGIVRGRQGRKGRFNSGQSVVNETRELMLSASKVKMT
jgi:hypothetical protein